MKTRIKLSILFLKEADSWVGQCLEHDIAAQGKTFEGAKRAISRTIAGQMCLDDQDGKEPLVSIAPAPEHYRNQFAKAVKLTFEVSDSNYLPTVDQDLRAVLA